LHHLLALELINLKHKWNLFYEMLWCIRVATSFIDCFCNLNKGIDEHKACKDFHKIGATDTFDLAKACSKHICNLKQHMTSTLIWHNSSANQEGNHNLNWNFVYEVGVNVWVKDDCHLSPPLVDKFILVSNKRPYILANLLLLLSDLLIDLRSNLVKSHFMLHVQEFHEVSEHLGLLLGVSYDLLLPYLLGI